MRNKLKLYKKYEEVVTALLSSKTNREACEKVGISEATLYRLLNKEDFVSLLEETRKTLFEQSLKNLASLSKQSVKNLSEIINSKDSKLSLKYNASKFILDKVFEQN